MNAEDSMLVCNARQVTVALAVSAASAAVYGQTAEIVGWVEPDPNTQLVPTAAFRLDRSGKTIAYPDAGLLACDKLTLIEEKAVVRVRLASNLRMQLDAESPARQIEVPCEQRGIAASLAAALRALISSAEQGKARVAALTREFAPLNLPVLVASQSNIVAGRRALYVAWTGGVGPFSVQVLNGSDGREVVSQTNIGSHSVVLPAAEIEPGQYTLWVRNRAEYRVEGIREDRLVVLREGALPTMPEVLKSSGLPDEARTLFYADYLAAQVDGRWTLEALQLVASLPTPSPAARQWLLRYGGRD